jgi:hypothetical protein
MRQTPKRLFEKPKVSVSYVVTYKLQHNTVYNIYRGSPIIVMLKHHYGLFTSY